MVCYVGVIVLPRHSFDDRTQEQLPEGKGWLYVETGGADRAEAAAKAEAIGREMGRYGASVKVVAEPAAMRALWKVREDGAGIVTRLPGAGRSIARGIATSAEPVRWVPSGKVKPRSREEVQARSVGRAG